MKKTQSLKLMLLGLMAAVSTSAWAVVGDVFVDQGGLIYQELANGKAKLIAIGSIGSSKVITIPTDVYNPLDQSINDEAKELQVTQVADDWYAPGKEIWIVQNGTPLYKATLKSALDYEGLTLKIDAAELLTISTKAIQPLNGNIKKFVVSATAGLTAIPAYAFFNGTETTPVQDEAVLAQNAALQAQIDIINNRINGFKKDGTNYFTQSDPAKRVYYLTKAPDSYQAATDANGNKIYVFNDNKNVINAISGVVISGVKAETEGQGFLKDAAGKVIAIGTGIDANDPLVLGLKPRKAAAEAAITEASDKIAEFENDATFLSLNATATEEAGKLKTLQDLQKLAQDNNLEQLWATNGITSAVYEALAQLSTTGLSAAEIAIYNTIKTKLDNIHWPREQSQVPDRYTAAEAVAYNEILEGAVDTDDINPVTGENYTEEEAAAYNAALDGAVKAGDQKKDGENNPMMKPATGYLPYNAPALQDKINSQKPIAEAAQKAVDEYTLGDDNKTYADYKKQKEDAEKEIAAINPILTADEAEVTALKGQMGDPTIPVYTASLDRYGNIVNNTTLQEVDLLGKGDLTDFGTSCFENCTEAKFKNQGGTSGPNIPVSTVNIAAKAFKNASIAPIFGKLTALETIGDEAFANSKAATANFQNSPNLYAFGEHVFDNCKLQNLLLKGTAIEADPDGPTYPEALAQYLYQEYAKFIDGCGNFYNYDLNNPADVAELEAKGYDQNTLISKNGRKELVNITLKKVSLPENIKAIPDNAFMNDIALVTLDGGIPAGVKTIGDMAFFRTQIAEFDLTDLVDLESIGAQAFAGNSELTKVILPQDKKDASGNVIAEAKMKTLGSGVFECDDDLATVILSPDITCLPEGTFKGNNKIEVLDLSNTQIEVLYNLFGTEAVAHINNYGEPYKVEYANTSLKRIILPSTVLDENNYAGEPVIPGLKVIMPNALAYMVGLGTVAKDGNKYGVEIPSSVEFMGDGAFFNCTNLETVTAMDSKLTTFGFNTFRNCRNLKEFTFVTLKIAQPFGTFEYDTDGLTNTCGIERYTTDGELVVHSFVTDENFFANNGSGTTKVIVTEETEDMIDKFFGKQNHGYAYLEIYQPVLTLPSGDGKLYTDGYSNENYATWIPMEEADVYTAYQDMNKIYMFKGKHNEGYYKIPAAYNNPVSAPSRMALPEPDPQDPQDPQLLPVREKVLLDFEDWLEEEYGLTYEEYEALSEELQELIDDAYDAYKALIKQEGFLEALLKTFTTGNNVYNFPQKAYSGTYIDWYFDGTDNKNGLSAAVIIIEKSNGGADGVKGKVPYERHSDPMLINHSTIDPCNQLRAVRTPIEFGDGSVSSNLYMWGYADNKPHTFHHIGSGTIPAGKIVLPLTRSNGAGTVYDPDPFDPSRDIEIIWVDGETTAIEYLKANTESLKTVDNAIYNLKGMRISTPVKGQMYIQNGKKFIQK